MNALRKSLPTAAEYLAAEREAAFKSEYVRGEVFAMSGAALDHNKISVNLTAEIRNALRGRPCNAFGSDMKVMVEAADCYFYPDLSGLCGTMDFPDGKQDVYTNPLFIIEILSDSTESYDRGGKFHDYQLIPSLREFVLVSQKAPIVEVFRKRDGGWFYESYRGMEAVLQLESVGCAIPFGEIYLDVEFEEAGEVKL